MKNQESGDKNNKGGFPKEKFFKEVGQAEVGSLGSRKPRGLHCAFVNSLY